MIGRADIEGSKSNVAMNAWLPQASYPCGNFSDTSSFKFRRTKGSIGHAFTVRIRTGNQNQTSFYPFVPHEISVLVELILGHMLMSRLFDARGRGPEGPVPIPSPDQHAATRSRRESSSSSTPTADGFGTGTPVPSPQSQSFSRGYGSILPTSLAYIVPSTRGCSPWRPDAVMSTTGRGRHSVLQIFKGRRGRTGHHATCGAFPAAGPYLRLSRFQDLHRRPLRPGSRPRFCSDRHALLLIGAWPLPRRPAILRETSEGTRYWTVRLVFRPYTQVRRTICTSVSLRASTRVSPGFAPLRHSSPSFGSRQTHWSVFQDGPNGEPAGRRPEHAGAEAHRDGARFQPQSR
ncbi:unnamed protein product [Lupinus luteus]|uniref:Senescence-associated protein n=1 Tax=Lupinus luteus TaxID=3873 RepID=A0AAV1VXY7_LUPLU